MVWKTATCARCETNIAKAVHDLYHSTPSVTDRLILQAAGHGLDRIYLRLRQQEDGSYPHPLETMRLPKHGFHFADKGNGLWRITW